MKKYLLLILFIGFAVVCFSQPKLETGIQLNGGWMFPAKASPNSNYKNGFSSGIDCYVAFHVWNPVSVITGFGYQYKEMQDQNVSVSSNGNYGSYSPYGYGYGNGGFVYRWEKFPHHYFRIPLKMRVTTRKGFFVQSGIEAGWLLNYDSENEKPEYNWAIGLGSSKHKLDWSLDYIQGFKEQGFGKITNGVTSATIYKNRMLQLSFSYPLWEK